MTQPSVITLSLLKILLIAYYFLQGNHILQNLVYQTVIISNLFPVSIRPI